MSNVQRSDLAHAFWRMALLTEAGTPLLIAIEQAWDHAGDRTFREALQEIHETWQRQNADCLPIFERRRDLFPRSVYQLCAVVWLTTMAEEPFRTAADLLLLDLRLPPATDSHRAAQRAGCIWLATVGRLVAVGVSFSAALEALKSDSDSPAMRELCTATAREISAGRSIAAALQTQPDFFNAADLAAVVAGESDGSLDTQLVRRADAAMAELGAGPSMAEPAAQDLEPAWLTARQQWQFESQLAAALSLGQDWSTALRSLTPAHSEAVAAVEGLQAVVAAGGSVETAVRDRHGPLAPWVALLIAQTALIGPVEPSWAAKLFRDAADLQQSELQWGPLPQPTARRQPWFLT